MRYLLDGYEYMDAVASQIPTGLQELVSRHRESLLLGISDPASRDKENALLAANREKNNSNLNVLRGELQTLTHQRSVLDVFTRNLIADTKNEYKRTASEDHAESRSLAVIKAKTCKFVILFFC